MLIPNLQQTLFLLIGRLIEAYSKSRTGDAVMMLVKLRPTEALLIESNSPAIEPPAGDISGETVNNTSATLRQEVSKPVPVDFLEFGDVVRIPKGGSPPCDGTVCSPRPLVLCEIVVKQSLTKILADNSRHNKI